jgi:hypothetical protein
MLKTLLPQLNMVVGAVLWEKSDEWLREKYLAEEFIEFHLDEFHVLRQGGRTVPDFEIRYMKILGYAPHLNTKKL